MASAASKSYPSRVDTWIAVILLASALATLVASAILVSTPMAGRWFVAVPLVVIAAGLPLSLLANTKYQFVSSHLQIGAGPFHWSVPVKEITAVSKTRNPLSSPALSFDRVLIQYGAGKSIMISPKDERAFLLELESQRSAAG